MDMLRIEKLKEPLDRVVSIIRNYNAILWAGSGMSLYAGYPSGAALCKKILEYAKTDEEIALLQKHESSLMDISNEFSQLYSRDTLIGILRTEFDIEPNTEPRIHSLVAKIPQISTVFTTNYDRLFEIAYKNITVFTGTRFSKSVRGIPDLYKIHGDTSDPDSIIITSLDYARFYGNLGTVLWGKIKGLLAEKSAIFVGYSLEDKNIQDVFEKVICQVDSSDKEFFIVTPTLHEHKLRHLNTICNTTHIPLSGEDFFEYVESEVRKNIVLDAVEKKVSVDEAYKICQEHGITPTITFKPCGDTTKPIIESVALSHDVYLSQIPLPFGRGARIVSNHDTYKNVLQFLNDCDCKELVIPAQDTVFYKDIKGIHIPEDTQINGKFPEFVKIEKQEIVEKLTLVLDDDSHHDCDVRLRGFWGNSKSRFTIEMACLDISILWEPETTIFNFSYRYPHSTNDALSDLLRLKKWSNGVDLLFFNTKKQQVFALCGFQDGNFIGNLIAFINDNLELYQKIQVIEDDLKDCLYIEKELIAEDIKNIHMASSSASPIRIKFMGSQTVNAGNMSLDQLEQCNSEDYSPILQMTYSEVLPEDCFQLLGKNIVLGIRRIKLLEPYIANYNEARSLAAEGKNVVLQISSKKGEAILEYIDPQGV